MKTFLSTILLISVFYTQAQQKNYLISLRKFQAKYVAEHEVVKGRDKKYFRFFPVDPVYRVQATFTRTPDTTGFIMKTSGTKTPKYFRYGTINFTIHDTLLHLTVYQSENLRVTDKYRDYLFVPFTDLTSGEESYGGGRYLEFYISDIKKNDTKKNKVLIDFNKAYNPYCAYATGYNCPVPPRENDLNIVIAAGEKMFAKEH